MEGTYCGKLCEECQYKEMLQCPGCKEGPGKAWNCECELYANFENNFEKAVFWYLRF